MNLGQNVCLDHLWVRFSKCYDTQVSITGPSWPSCFSFNPCPAEPRYSLFANSVDPDQLASEEVSLSISALLAIQYVNFYQQSGSRNLIG